ncbi:hypothetical protein BDK51DRAFT_35307, partial [Blyttiomyces helicus]
IPDHDVQPSSSTSLAPRLTGSFVQLAMLLGLLSSHSLVAPPLRTRSYRADEYLLGAWRGRYAIGGANEWDRLRFNKAMRLTFKEMREGGNPVVDILGTGRDLLAPLTEFQVKVTVYVEAGRVEMVTTCPGAVCVYYGALTPFGLAGRHGSGVGWGPFWLRREGGEEEGRRWEAGVTDEVAPPVMAAPVVAVAPGDEPEVV